MEIKIKKIAKIRRHRRVRAKIFGTEKLPRLCVFRSPKHIYAQLINDEKGITLISASDQELKETPKDPDKSGPTGQAKIKKQEVELAGKVAIAAEVGKLIAKKAKIKKIEKIVFDRGGYKYHGRVKALAEGARSGGLKF